MDDIDKTLNQRGNKYGKFTDNAYTSQYLKDVIRCHNNYINLSSFHIEALEMIFHKIARIINGDPNYADSWVDIAGYAKLVANKLESENDYDTDS